MTDTEQRAREAIALAATEALLPAWFHTDFNHRQAKGAVTAAILAASPPTSGIGEGFLDQLRRVNLDRYEAWVTTEVPLMLCEHCGRSEGDAASSGSTHCNAPFDPKEHTFTRPHPYLTHEVRSDAGIMFDALELGGEVGELLNVVKKLEREDRGWRGSRAQSQDFADECADVLICLDKLARRRGVDLAEATIAKFNATSDKIDLPHRLAKPRAVESDGVREAAKPFLAEIDRLEREYGFDRPLHQGQCMMLPLSDLIAFRAALSPSSPEGEG